MMEPQWCVCSVDNHSTRNDNASWAASHVPAGDGRSGWGWGDAPVYTATAAAAAANGGRSCRHAAGGRGAVHGGDDW